MENLQQQSVEGHHHRENFKIVVNGRPRDVHMRELTFDDVVDLAFPGAHGPNVFFTVTYRKAEGNKEGTLVQGQEVKIKDGTIFNVTKTDKS
jgi:Multiubiquitin